ncbi:uncharacterized protein LOC132040580 [Lycium ferocissimum]|uniref:uncharacterized protein LOC132040580 n=1 Tax=Lycium ferocissimum TaxID=112874 RepID=UPI0028157976|nr:uncharacterized protein LOC132040580 [Lycium ferocissimum]
MKGRKCKEAPSTDLLVCFPSRAHLTLMPSPATHHHHHLRRSNTRGIGPAGQASPMYWAKSKRTEISEPTSPKVTCAGQIKVRTKPKSCKIKNWQSVMEEIEKLHVKKHKKKKKPVWMEAMGFKKDAMQFLTCLRNIRFDFRCFGSFNTAETDIITSDDDQEDEEEVEENDNEVVSRTVFSKWFMVLQENQKTEYTKTEETECSVFEDHDDGTSCAPPPPNALLLMRCRSAPAKGLVEQKHDEEGEEEEEDDDDEQKDVKSRMTESESTKKNKKNLVVMRYGSDLFKFSSDIAKENWVVGGIKDQLSRSRSSKR